jgi:hypothetical protein
MAIKHTIIYQSHFELMDNLSDEQAGILIKSIGLFQKGIEPNISDPMVFGIFLAIKRDFQIQSENYQKKVKANQENGAKGGRPKVSINPSNPVGYLETQANPQNLKDKDKDKDKDIDIDIDKDKDKDNSSLPGIAVNAPDFKPILSTEEFDNIFND